MFQFRQVLVRMRQGDSDRDMARDGLMGRKKLKQVRATAAAQGWLVAGTALPDDAALAAVWGAVPRAATCVSTLEPLRETVAKWFADGLQGTTIHAALKRRHGYTGSYSAVRRMLRGMAAEVPVAATSRLDFSPGEAAQVDFGRGPDFVDVLTGVLLKTWFFVMTLAWSRHQFALLVLDQTVETWLRCHRLAFEWFGGVPKRIIIDNPKCAITRACITDPTVQRAYADWAEDYGFKISPCPPRDPKKKGIVESGVKYIKRGFLPLRDFRSLADGNQQLHAWVLGEAGNRCHGTTREAPLARFSGTEKALLKSLPERPPEIARWAAVQVHRDSHVSFDKALYSVPFALIGERLWLRATATLVQCFREHQLVASHPRVAPGRRSTVRDHLPPDAQAYAMADPQHCLQQAARIGPSCRRLIEHLFSDRVLDHLRAAQGVVRLEQKFGATRLEAACHRALAFDAPRYRTVKTILDKGLDLQAAHDAFDAMAETYTHGGRFCRDLASLLHH